jgi:hypothetical protein
MPTSPSPLIRLTGGGTFASAGDGGWIDFLSRQGREPTQEYSFVARNFVLDEGILPDRAQSYEHSGAVADHGTIEAWKGAHNDYLEKWVFLVSDDDGPPTVLDVEEPDEVPETFRHVDPQSPFLETALNGCLVRVEQVDSGAAKAGVESTRIRDLAEEVLAHRTPTVERDFNGHLNDWFLELDQRPVFAAFWDDVADLFAPDPLRDQDGWADKLRDRMGLAHLDPSTPGVPGIDVLVFRYEVRAIPRIKGTGGDRRPLVTPTVLDGTFSRAFCPSPRASVTGHVVNLNPIAGMLRREVLHPRFAFRVSHLWRLGALRRAVDLGQLPEARALHLLTVRDETGRDDYASGTDQDLF